MFRRRFKLQLPVLTPNGRGNRDILPGCQPGVSDADRRERLLRVRKPPVPFGSVHVVERSELSPRLLRLTVEGEVLVGWHVPQPASSMRMVVPWPDEPLELPEWNGNEFLLADGRRPALRTSRP